MRYHSPQTFAEAAALAASCPGTVKVFSGGTDFLVQLRAGATPPDDLIDLKKAAGATDIVQNADGSWTLGASVSGAQMGDHAGLVADWPGVVEGMQLVGSTQVQGRATMAGNLCNASPAADSVPGMVAAGAVATITGPDGTREIAVGDIPASPGKTNLKKGEIISAITLPARGQNAGDAYLRFIPRSEMDIAVVGCAVSLRVDGGKITEARVSLGAVAPTVLLVQECADAIIGTTLDDAALEKLAKAAEAACKPISDRRGTAEFRVDVAGVLARRAARIAYDRATGATK